LIKNFCLDIVAISETWLSEKFDDSLLSFDSNFQVFRTDRSSVKLRGGGVALLVKSHVNAFIYDSLALKCGCELLCVDFPSPTKFRVIIGYRAPDCPACETEVFLDRIADWCSVLQPSVIVGDFNFSFDFYSFSENFSAHTLTPFESFLIGNNLFCLSNFPTKNQSFLDVVLTNELSLVNNVSTQKNFSTSDHCAVSFTLNYHVPDPPVSSFFDFVNGDWQAANDLLFKIDWPDVFSDFCSVNDMYLKFLNIVWSVINLFVPLCNKRVSYSKFPNYLQNLAAKKHFLWLNRLQPGGLAAFQKCSRDFAVQCRKYAKNFEKRLICSGNDNLFYKYLNKKIHSKFRINFLEGSNGGYITDDCVKANCFASYFASIFKPDNGLLPVFPPMSSASLDSVDTSPKAICDAISKLKDKISLTPDQIPSYFLKRTATSISFPLSLIFEKSILLGTLPNFWKTSFIFPLLQKPPSHLVCNYRPICLTSSVCKVLEILIKETFLDHLLASNLLNSSQFGFLPNKSTLSQLILSINDWVLAADQNSVTTVAYLDYAKAFDTVSHTKLLYKLQSYGLSGSLFNWLSSFISDRSFTVRVGNSESDIFRVLSGVPQGSILGPLLFILFVNDLPNAVQSVCRLFADDVKIYRCFRSLQNDVEIFQNDLNSVVQWSQAWQLSLSFDKCFLLSFPRSHFYNFKLGNVNLSAVDECVRDLGVFISNDLNWSTHCSVIASKAQRVANCILRSLQHPCLSHYKLAFITYCRPILEYCSQVWSPYKKSDIYVVEKVQKFFTKLAFKRIFPGPLSPGYKDRLRIFQLKSLEYRRCFLDLVLCYKIINGISDISFQQIFDWGPIQDRRSNNFQLARKACHKNLALHWFSFRVVRVWNKLPQEIVGAQTLVTFQKRLKFFDLDTIGNFVF